MASPSLSSCLATQDGIRQNNIIVLISESSGHAVAWKQGKIQAIGRDFSKLDGK